GYRSLQVKHQLIVLACSLLCFSSLEIMNRKFGQQNSDISVACFFAVSTPVSEQKTLKMDENCFTCKRKG
ncbi:MAG: hypothetical protein OXI24_19295, partial [Candidatus Poribacteria bacterium]|nr:hypothetical protein [Candidatus Poribacteria bacterium]